MADRARKQGKTPRSAAEVAAAFAGRSAAEAAMLRSEARAKAAEAAGKAAFNAARTAGMTAPRAFSSSFFGGWLVHWFLQGYAVGIRLVSQAGVAQFSLFGLKRDLEAPTFAPREIGWRNWSWLDEPSNVSKTIRGYHAPNEPDIQYLKSTTHPVTLILAE